MRPIMAEDASDVRFATTLRALAAPRRALPIAAVAAAMIGAQVTYAPPEAAAAAATVPLAMVAGFALLAPWSWRAWARRSRLGVLAYVAAAAAVVAACGVALPSALGLGATYFTDVGSLGIAAVLYAVGGWGLGRDIELEHGLEGARLLALHTHLDPHFLYNTLNAIAEWCAEDAAVAEEAITRLAGMMRELLAGLELARWPLAREVRLAEDLLELHRVRDGEAMTVQVTLDDAAGAVEVPPLLLLTLVENAVKHGPRSGHRGLVQLAVRVRGNAATNAAANDAANDAELDAANDAELEVECAVENPGPLAPAPVDAARAGGHGLPTLRRRLRHAYHGRARLTLAQLDGSPDGAPDGPRTRAVLTLPAARRARRASQAAHSGQAPRGAR